MITLTHTRRGFSNSADNTCTETMYLTDVKFDEVPEIDAIERIGQRLYEHLGGPLMFDQTTNKYRTDANVSIQIGTDIRTGCWVINIREKNTSALKRIYGEVVFDEE